jgi:hypothetical protein
MNEKAMSFEDVYDDHKRLYPWYKGPQKLRRILGWFDANELRISVLVFILASIILLLLDLKYGVRLSDILVEAHGLLMDIVVFGCLILWFNLRRDKRERIRQYRETLEDLSDWDSEEGVLKKVGVINRLLDIGGPQALPYLDSNQLPNANFQGVYMPGACLSFSNLTNAFLNGIYLAGAELIGSNLNGACLASAVLENADLRGANLAGADLEEIKLNGAKLGSITIGDKSYGGATTYTTDLRGVIGLTPEALMSTEGWEQAYRDEQLACGKPIPQQVRQEFRPRKRTPNRKNEQKRSKRK